jgi:uncharacterized protein involved in type VI secretion and phage assembly
VGSAADVYAQQVQAEQRFSRSEQAAWRRERKRSRRAVRSSQMLGLAFLEHDPKKHAPAKAGWMPILGKDHARNNNLERADGSKRNHRALETMIAKSRQTFRTTSCGKTKTSMSPAIQLEFISL